MNEPSTAETSTTPGQGSEPQETAGFFRFLAGSVILLRLATASTHGIRHCFLEESAATQRAAGVVAESSTQLQEIAPELRVKLDAILDAARHEAIEDGMRNSISEHLPALVAQHSNTVVSALVAVIESGRATPIVAAEVLKELGRLRNVTSHASRRWALERALHSPWPFTRDGAGLGLARLGDPGSIPSLCRALENETNAQIKADLQLVIGELADVITDGELAAKRH